MLAALPKPEPLDTPRFASVVVCARCHTAGDKAMRDSRGRDISPLVDAQSGVMALSARDPYYLAALRRELAANPGAKRAIEQICTRCHAPVGFAESGGTLALDDLTAGKTPAAILGREGVACAGCHSLAPEGLGTEASFAGHSLRIDRVSFGALSEPLAEAMLAMSKTRPVPSKHVSQSRLCASCHTVLVHALDSQGAPIGDEIAEQTTYLEWRNSSFQDEVTPAGRTAITCQGCHMPRGEDELGKAPPITTPFSTRPPDAPPREGYRRHTLRGGNSYLLRQLARDAAWLSSAASATELAAAADGTDTFLGSAAELELAVGPGSPAFAGAPPSRPAHEVAVTIINKTGHKLPTGYPTRRMWLHVVAADRSGATVFESGASRDGAIVDGKHHRLDLPGAIVPHRSELASADDVIIYEAVPVDALGKRTHLLLGTAAMSKDNRILPAGWRPDHADGKRTRPIGTDGDADFLPGRDTVTLRLPAGVRSVSVELLYQSIPPETIESYRATDSLEAARFLNVARTPPAPVTLARVSRSL